MKHQIEILFSDYDITEFLLEKCYKVLDEQGLVEPDDLEDQIGKKADTLSPILEKYLFDGHILIEIDDETEEVRLLDPRVDEVVEPDFSDIVLDEQSEESEEESSVDKDEDEDYDEPSRPVKTVKLFPLLTPTKSAPVKTIINPVLKPVTPLLKKVVGKG